MLQAIYRRPGEAVALLVGRQVMEPATARRETLGSIIGAIILIVRAQMWSA
jgi:hypothetical protein